MVDFTIGISLPIIGGIIALVGYMQKRKDICVLGLGILGYAYMTNTMFIS